MRSLKSAGMLIAVFFVSTMFVPVVNAEMLQYVRSWSTQSIGIFGLAIGQNGNVYVADQITNSIKVYSPDGAFLWSWGTEGTENGQFLGPRGVGIDSSNGDVYVTNEEDGRVQRFTATGDFLNSWNTAGDDTLHGPFDVCVGTEGNVWVADTFNSMIRVFTPEGIFLKQWGGFGTDPGQLGYPMSIEVRGSSVYVVDSYQPRMSKFDTSGVWQWSRDSVGVGNGPFQPLAGICRHPIDGLYYITEWGGHRIHRFDEDGTWHGSYGQWGSSPGRFEEPTGITAGYNGWIYVADTDNARIQVFRLPEQLSVGDDRSGLQLSASPNPGRHPIVRFSLAQSSPVNVTVYDIEGRAVETLVSAVLGPGNHARPWNGSAHSPGVYFIRLTAERQTQTFRSVLLQ